MGGIFYIGLGEGEGGEGQVLIRVAIDPFFLFCPKLVIENTLLVMCIIPLAR